MRITSPHRRGLLLFSPLVFTPSSASYKVVSVTLQTIRMTFLADYFPAGNFSSLFFSVHFSGSESTFVHSCLSCSFVFHCDFFFCPSVRHSVRPSVILSLRLSLSYSSPHLCLYVCLSFSFCLSVCVPVSHSLYLLLTCQNKSAATNRDKDQKQRGTGVKNEF